MIMLWVFGSVFAMIILDRVIQAVYDDYRE